MALELHQDAHTFLERALPLLLRHEAESCVSLGLLSRLVKGPRLEDEVLPVMAGFTDPGGRITAAGTQSVGSPLLLTAEDPQSAASMAEELYNSGVNPPGVISSIASAEAFAATWSRRTGSRLHHGTRLGVYQTDRVVAPKPAPGHLRLATESDLPIVRTFADEFHRAIGEAPPAGVDAAGRAVKAGRLHVWSDPDGRIVSMAAWAGQTPNGVRVNFVYTPAGLRGRGYASNCVAALTQKLLSSGRKFVFLFTDLSNATSNGMYRSIGYEHITDQLKIHFKPC